MPKAWMPSKRSENPGSREFEMRDVVIGLPKRTPVGAFGGSLRDVAAVDLAATVIEAVVDEADLDPSAIDDVILGHCYPSGESPAIGRVAALQAGLPVHIPGWQLDRRCGSGLQAVCTAAMQVQSGVSDLVLAGGTESMSQVEHYALGLRFGSHNGTIELLDRLQRARVTAGSSRHPVPGGMIETAENVRERFGISREEQDVFALESHRRAVEAQKTGKFDRELVPVRVDTPNGRVEVVEDEHPRPDTSMEALARLKPIRLNHDPNATVTAGNSSGQNDGAAVCIVTTSDRTSELGLQPLLRLVSWGTGGVDPAYMGMGPVPATAVALERAGLALGDIDLIEVNEAFAVQVLAVTREWSFKDEDFQRLNVNGSGISLGHPVGATGARILATLAHEMDRRSARYGLETMCIGGGQGIAAVFERI